MHRTCGRRAMRRPSEALLSIADAESLRKGFGLRSSGRKGGRVLSFLALARVEAVDGAWRLSSASEWNVNRDDDTICGGFLGAGGSEPSGLSSHERLDLASADADLAGIAAKSAEEWLPASIAGKLGFDFTCLLQLDAPAGAVRAGPWGGVEACGPKGSFRRAHMLGADSDALDRHRAALLVLADGMDAGGQSFVFESVFSACGRDLGRQCVRGRRVEPFDGSKPEAAARNAVLREEALCLASGLCRGGFEDYDGPLESLAWNGRDLLPGALSEVGAVLEAARAAQRGETA